MNQWFIEVYGDFAENLIDQFGCDNAADGSVVDCQDHLDRFLTASTWSCNSRNAFNGEGKVFNDNLSLRLNLFSGLRKKLATGQVGPIFPMEWRHRNCDPDASGQNTKSCHCSEGGWINSNTNLNQEAEPWKTFGLEFRDAFGEFYRKG